MAKKPTFCFRFTNVESATKFMQVAEKHRNASKVYYPAHMEASQFTLPDYRRVYVVGSGMNARDFQMRSELVKIATNLGGEVFSRNPKKK